MSHLDALLSQTASVAPSRVFLRGSEEWSYRQAEEEVSRRSEVYRRTSNGLPVAIRAESGTNWVIDVLACMRGGLPAILVPYELTPEEAEALMRLAGTAYLVESGLCTATSIEAKRVSYWSSQDVAVAFSTSGSTGEPRLALRSHGSLMDEGNRYQKLWHATSDTVFFTPAPLYHAFPFGAALASVLCAGATLVVVGFKSARRVSSQILEYSANIVLLVPAIARALAIVDQGRTITSSLKIAMVGAGAISDELSALFCKRWNVGLSRNYGSSETGAVLAALYPDGAGSTGRQMAGVACEFVPSAHQQVRQLWVKLEFPPIGYCGLEGFDAAQLAPGNWWPMGDMFEAIEKNGAPLLSGRRGATIRRGGHTIQPREVEAALLATAAVAEAFVKAGVDANGEQTIEAHVALTEPHSLAVNDLRNWLLTRIAAYKVPTKWVFYDRLPRTWSHKVKVQQLEKEPSSGSPSLIAAVQGFRISHAISAAQEVGLLDTLTSEPQPISYLSARTSCDPQALELFCEFLVGSGLLAVSDSGYKLAYQPHATDMSVCLFESLLRREWLSTRRIVDALRQGFDLRAFEKEGSNSAFGEAYLEAFCGPWQDLAALKMRLTLQLKAGLTAIEIGRAAGRITQYFREVVSMNCLYQALGPPPASAWHLLDAAERSKVCTWSGIPLAAASADLIVLTNVIHWLVPGIAQEVLTRLGKALCSGGTLVIIDSFVDASPDSAPYLLDWLTHGGVHWTQLSLLKEALYAAGFSIKESSTLRGTAALLMTCVWRDLSFH